MATDSFLLDKSVFLATNAQELCNFAEKHTVILPETLFYECYTSPELSDSNLFKRLDEVLMAGAHVTYQLMEIIQLLEAQVQQDFRQLQTVVLLMKLERQMKL